MKYAKISIVFIVLSIIAYQVYQQRPDISPVDTQVEHAKSNDVNSIGKEIVKFKSINSISDCMQHYNNLMYAIENTIFDDESSTNKSIVENMHKNLFSGYSSRFIVLAQDYMLKHDWCSENMVSIQNACNSILSSPLMASDAGIRASYKPITDVFQLKEQILSHLNKVEKIGSTCIAINNDFPDYSNDISTSLLLYNKINANTYFNKCVTLKDRLRNVRNEFFEKHVKYLENMVRRASHNYYNYAYQSDYVENVYDIILAKVKNLKNYSFYYKSTADMELYQTSLINKLQKVNQDAYDFYFSDNHVCQFPK